MPSKKVCRICANPDLKVFLSLGSSALANNLPSKKELGKEEVYPLDLAFCDKCTLVQLTDVVPPEKMFSDYLYVTSTTQTFKYHFAHYANWLTTWIPLKKDDIVVDIGSNDGLLLKNFKANGMKIIGVEPAKNLAEQANKEGIFTINKYFGADVSKQILNDFGKVDLVTANNVFAHIDDINDVTENVKLILKKDGYFVIECAYLFDMFEKMTWDLIYHEHLSYYSLTALYNFFKRKNMQVAHVEHVDSHGGSLRVYVKNTILDHEHESLADEDVKKLLNEEEQKGVQIFSIYEEFGNKVTDSIGRIQSFVAGAKTKANIIVGYGAPAKATTLLSVCKLTNYSIDYIVDDNPLKQGRYIPIANIPIVNAKMLDKKAPNIILIFAWNFAPEIVKKLEKYRGKGVQFVVPFPEVKFL